MNRRSFLLTSSAFAGAMAFHTTVAAGQGVELNVLDAGAIGDGKTLDTMAIQKAIDDVSARGGGRVLIPSGKDFLIGGIMLRDNVDLHLVDDAVLLASPDSSHYTSKTNIGVINAYKAKNVRVSGNGHIDGQAMKFMGRYSPVHERWEPRQFRPRMFHLLGVTGLEITGISFGHSPEWGLHTVGCEHVLVDGIRIRNYLDVPNCDGIDPDRCRDMEIKNCDVVCADDGIVIKTSEGTEEFGVAHNITVSDCSITCRDSGLKIGTETFGDISKVLFQRCRIVSGGRGPTITHRQPGNIEDVEFRDIEFLAQHHAARWWGWGEAASVTAWHRKDGVNIGRLRNIRMKNIRGAAENSFRIDSHPDMQIEDVLLEKCDVTIDRWTQYPGGAFDNRPTQANDPMKEPGGLEKHGTPAFSLRNARNVTVRDCSAHWGLHIMPYFSHALEAESITNLKIEHFTGQAARPGLKAIMIR